MATLTKKRSSALAPRIVAEPLQEPPTALESQHLLEECLVQEKFMLAALEVLQKHPDIQICNALLQVSLELDVGTALMLVTKSIENEVTLAVKKMSTALVTTPRASVVSTIASFLLRETRTSVFMIVEFCRIIGTTYLQSVLQDVIVAVESHSKLLQTLGNDNEVLATTEKAATEKMAPEERRAQELLVLMTQLVTSILKITPAKVPPFLRYLIKFFHSLLVVKISEATGHQVTAEESCQLLNLVVCHVLGLRFFGLGLICPALYSLPDPRTEFSQDCLITLADILCTMLGLPPKVAEPGAIHGAEARSDSDTFFVMVSRQKTNKDLLEKAKTQLLNWMTQIADFTDLTPPPGPFAFFALETYGNMVGTWVCEHTLEFLNLCTPPLEYRYLYEFIAANKVIITQMAKEDRTTKAHLSVGPGKWSPIQYGRCWNHEFKLPGSRKEDLLVSVPQAVPIESPAPRESIIDWTLDVASRYDFLLLIFVSSSTKIGASAQKYVRSWKKSVGDFAERNGLIMAISPATHTESAYVHKKFASNFPIVFDPHENLAAHLGVAGYGEVLTGPDDISLAVLDACGNVITSWENHQPNEAPTPKIVLAAVIHWIRDAKARRTNFSLNKLPSTTGASSTNLLTSSRRHRKSQGSDEEGASSPRNT